MARFSEHSRQVRCFDSTNLVNDWVVSIRLEMGNTDTSEGFYFQVNEVLIMVKDVFLNTLNLTGVL